MSFSHEFPAHKFVFMSIRCIFAAGGGPAGAYATVRDIAQHRDSTTSCEASFTVRSLTTFVLHETEGSVLCMFSRK